MASKDQVDKKTKLLILREKLQLWENTAFDASIDLKVAERVSAQRLENEALQRLKQAEKALALLQEEIITLEKQDTGTSIENGKGA